MADLRLVRAFVLLFAVYGKLVDAFKAPANSFEGLDILGEPNV